VDYDNSWSTGELWDNLFALRLWLWLIANAEHSDKTLEISTYNITVHSGELITSYNTMAEGISWSARAVERRRQQSKCRAYYQL